MMFPFADLDLHPLPAFEIPEEDAEDDVVVPAPAPVQGPPTSQIIENAT